MFLTRASWEKRSPSCQRGGIEPVRNKIPIVAVRLAWIRTLCHKGWQISVGRYARQHQSVLCTGKSRQANTMGRAKTIGQMAFAALLSLSLVVWSVMPTATHAPAAFVETIQSHIQMIADHGHSHGFEEDLFWAMHGHNHDAADHDHSTAFLALGAGSQPFLAYRDAWRLRPSPAGPQRIFRIERPPRA